MKRIGIAMIKQETNSFNPVPTTRDDFSSFGVGRGEEVMTRFGAVDELGGFLAGVRQWPDFVAPVGLFRAQAWPGGPITRETRQWLRDGLAEQLRLEEPLDGLLLALHGSLVGHDEDDVDGYLLETVREILGPRVPVVATLDLHAYCTPRMIQNAGALVAYHTSPHLDMRETGLRAAKVLWQMLSGAHPAAAMVRLPMISISEAQNTFGAVLKPVYDYARRMESHSGVLSVAVLMTQGWLNVPALGWSTVVMTDGDLELAHTMADELARMCWSRRSHLTAEYLDPKESVTRALELPGKPVVIADGADATNSGAGGDSVHLLNELLKHEIPEGALTLLVDPEAVAQAHAAGEGGAFAFCVGGKRDNVFSKPLPVTGRVLTLRRARYVLTGHCGDNLEIDMGLSAVIKVADVTVLLVERSGPGGTPMMYRCVGLEPKDFKIVVVKSPAGFRAEFEPFAAGILLSDGPGCASPHYEKLPYTKIDRPLWPIDTIDDWDVSWIKRSCFMKGTTL